MIEIKKYAPALTLEQRQHFRPPGLRDRQLARNNFHDGLRISP